MCFSVRHAAVCCVLLLVPANLFALQAFLDNGGYMNDTATGWAPLPGQQQGQRRAGFAGEWLWCSGGPGEGEGHQVPSLQIGMLFIHITW